MSHIMTDIWDIFCAVCVIHLLENAVVQKSIEVLIYSAQLGRIKV